MPTATVVIDSSSWDRAMARLQQIADAAPQTAAPRQVQPRQDDGSVAVVTPEHIRDACRLWQTTRQRPAFLRQNSERQGGRSGMENAMAGYLESMAEALNTPAAYPIRRRWARVVRHVMFLTQYWPTEKDLMEAARDLARGE